MENSGLVLKRKLGLDNFKNVRICRVLGFPKRIFYVFYNSYRPERVLTIADCQRLPRTSSIFLGDILDDEGASPLRYYPTTVPIFIEKYSGNININTFIIAIDLAGSRYGRENKFSRKLKESSIKETLPKTYKVSSIEEGITLYDLTKNAGLSDFTSYYAKERARIMGKENSKSKLIDCKVNKEENYVEFYFLSEATEKYEASYKYKEVDPFNNFKLKDNSSKLYTFIIRVLDFFDWLDSSQQVKDSISSIDVKDIFEVAEIQIFDSTPQWHWQGCNYNMSSVFDASIYPTDIPPSHWNHVKNKHNGSEHKGNQLLSKYGQRIINQIAFWSNPMASMLTKRLKDEGLI